MFIFCVIGVAKDEGRMCKWLCDSNHNIRYYCDPGATFQNAALVMNYMLSVIAIVQAATSIWGSVLCYQSGGCCNTTKIHQQQSVLSLPTQYVTIQGGQQMTNVTQSGLNYGGQVAYKQGQQSLTVPAPPYQSNYRVTPHQ